MLEHGSQTSNAVADETRFRLREDLTNHAVTIWTGPEALRCIAQPRRQIGTIVVGIFGVLMALLPLTMMTKQLMRLQEKREMVDLVSVLLALVPATLAVLLFVRILVVMRRKRGLEILDGVVTLYTPDNEIPQHQFNRSNLAGAHLARSGDFTKADLRIARRKGLDVTVFRSYHPNELGPAVDAINAMVLEHHVAAFEVIPMAQPVHVARPIDRSRP